MHFLPHSPFALTGGIISTEMGRGKGKEGLHKLLYELPPLLLVLRSHPVSTEYFGFPFCSPGKTIPAVKLPSPALHMHLLTLVIPAHGPTESPNGPGLSLCMPAQSSDNPGLWHRNQCLQQESEQFASMNTTTVALMKRSSRSLLNPFFCHD